MLEIIVYTFDEVRRLDEDEKELIIKSLRLMLLVGDEEQTTTATRLLDLLLTK